MYSHRNLTALQLPHTSTYDWRANLPDHGLETDPPPNIPKEIHRHFPSQLSAKEEPNLHFQYTVSSSKAKH